MEDDQRFMDERTPAQCRNGPIEDRVCTDCFCCLMYVILIAAAIFLAVFAGGSSPMTPQEIQDQLKNTSTGEPLLAIIHSIIPILLSLAFVMAICFILVLTTFCIPSIVAYIYIPIFLILMLFAGVLFILRYCGINLPVISHQIQEQYTQKGDITILIIGVAFLIGFIATLITICSKRSKFSNIVYVLRIAKTCFWSNCYIFFYAILFCIISIAALVANYYLLTESQTKKQSIIDPKIIALIIAVEFLWTHGFMEALSDFFFESIAIHWYFKKRREENEEESCCDSLCLTNRLTLKHIGTIAFGHVLAYIPETFNTMLGRCEKNCNCCYSVFCCCHRFTFRHLTKYCYIETILQSQSFCTANKEMFGLRKRTKSMIPELYMMGNFYITLAKIFAVMSGLIICYSLIDQYHPEVMKSGLNLIGPMLITFFGSLELSNHLMNMTGLIGDTLVFMYCVDVEIEKKNYGEMDPYSCPETVNDIIREVKAGNTYVYDE